MSIATNISSVNDRILSAAKRVNRNPKEIKLVVAGKYVDSQKIREVIKAGAKIIGENREQDLKRKFKAIGNKADWHFIGHLQRNKVKSVIGMVSMIHSLDSFRLAQELEKRLSNKHKKITALIEVNTSNETTKHGLVPNKVMNFAKKFSEFEYLKIVGLMAMGSFVKNAEENRQNFRELRKLLNKINSQQFKGANKYKHLSMGTTQDFEIAIEEGATLVRVGSAIFKD